MDNNRVLTARMIPVNERIEENTSWKGKGETAEEAFARRLEE